MVRSLEGEAVWISISIDIGSDGLETGGVVACDVEGTLLEGEAEGSGDEWSFSKPPAPRNSSVSMRSDFCIQSGSEKWI